jgi:hypothetical protein
LVAVIVYENAVPTVPLAEVALLMTGFATETVNVKVALPVPPALIALRVTEDVAAVVGVPDITPVAVLIDSPAGRPVAP